MHMMQTDTQQVGSQEGELFFISSTTTPISSFSYSRSSISFLSSSSCTFSSHWRGPARLISAGGGTPKSALSPSHAAAAPQALAGPHRAR